MVVWKALIDHNLVISVGLRRMQNDGLNSIATLASNSVELSIKNR